MLFRMQSVGIKYLFYEETVQYFYPWKLKGTSWTAYGVSNNSPNI